MPISTPRSETIFERLEDAGTRTACTPFLIYRGRHRHQVSLDGLLAARGRCDPAQVPTPHLGPARALLRRPLREPRGSLQALLDPRQPRRLFGLLRGGAGQRATSSTSSSSRCPITTTTPTATGREASVESIAKADHCFATLVEAGGGLDRFLAEHALILLADHAQTPVHRGLPLAELLGREWSVLQPSEERPEDAAACGQSDRARRARLPACREGERADRRGRQRLAEIEGVDLVCRLERADGEPLQRRRAGCARRAGASGGDRTRRGGDSAFGPGEICRRPAWRDAGSSTESTALLGAEIEDGRLRSEAYPDPLRRVWSALTAPHAGDFVVSLAPGFEAVDWGGVTHAGGGSHGALHAGDSLGPLLFVGCGPERADEREQWTLRDVAPVVLEHFGVGDAA